MFYIPSYKLLFIITVALQAVFKSAWCLK